MPQSGRITVYADPVTRSRPMQPDWHALGDRFVGGRSPVMTVEMARAWHITAGMEPRSPLAVKRPGALACDTPGMDTRVLVVDDHPPPVVVLISGRDPSDFARISGCGAVGFLAKSEFFAESLRRLTSAKAAS